MKNMSPKLDPRGLYLGDNGRCFCGEHAGASAKYSGRDISGQKVLRLTFEMLKAEGYASDAFKCETCGASLQMVRLVSTF